MGRNEFSSASYRVWREPEGLRIVVRVKPDGFRTLLNLIWILIWAAGEVVILLSLLGVFGPAGSALPRPLDGLFLTAFSVVGGIVLWRWLWRVGGREVFRIARSGLSARREILGIGRTRSFPVEKLRNVRGSRLKYRILHPTWGRMFIGPADFEIVIAHAGGSCAYGKGLQEGEAVALAGLLKGELGLQVRRHPPVSRHSAFLK